MAPKWRHGSSLDNLTELVKFQERYCFFDNDETGIKASKDITDIINSISRVRLNLYIFLKIA
jgi:hypothetical protein